jgi:hypothetical protein
VLVDADEKTKKPAFDHDKLAAAISAAMGQHYTALTLPFVPAGGRGAGAAPGALTFRDNERAIEFGAAGFLWNCTLSDYTCTKGATIPQAPAGGRGGAPDADPDPLAAPEPAGVDPADGLEYVMPAPPQDEGPGGGSAIAQRNPCANNEAGQGRGGRGGGRGASATAGAAQPAAQVCRSFDGKWEALVQNFNVFLRPVGSSDPATPLSFDGSAGNYYTFQSIAWSPDSKKLAAYHTRPGYDRQVHYIESSPVDQIQPKHTSRFYLKPGDALDMAYPALFDLATKQETEIDQELFPNAYAVGLPVWWKDSRAFTFAYNQRGHQVYGIIEVNAQTGKARALIDEQSKTFINYTHSGRACRAGDSTVMT